MLSMISTMSAPASVTIAMEPLVIWAMLAFFLVACLGILHAAWVVRKRARREAAELESLEILAGRLPRSGGVAHRPLAA